MKCTMVLLLLCSYVMAKDVDLADYPMTFHVDYARSRNGCVMGLSDRDGHSYVVTNFVAGVWCFDAGGTVRGNFRNDRADRHNIFLVYKKKGKLKLVSYTIESEPAY